MLRYRPWKYTKYSLRALPCLTQFFLEKNGSAPLWCASSLACTFRSPVLIRSFCLRVFAFPFGSARRGLSRVIHPGHIHFFRPFLYRRHKKPPGKPTAFCVLSVAPPLFAVKCFFTAENNLRRSRRGLPPLQGEVAEPPAAKPEGSALRQGRSLAYWANRRR